MQGHPGRRVLVPLGLGTALSLLGDSTLYTVLAEPSMAAQFNLSLSAIGLALGINRLVRVAFNGLAGTPFDRLPRKPLLLASLLLGTSANAAYGVASGPSGLLFGRVLWGAAWSGIWVGAHAVILDISEGGTRGRIGGGYQMWFFAGVAATALAGGALTDILGLRPTLWIAAGASGAAFLLWWWALPETSDHRADVRQARSQEIAAAFPWLTVLAAGIPYFAIRVTSAGVLASTTILWLGGFLRDGSLSQVSTLLPLATITGLVAAGRTLLGIGGAPVAGWFSDRLRRRWPLIAISLLLGSLGLALMATAGLAIAMVGLALNALTGPTVQALSPAILGDRVRASQMGRALGMLFTMADLGSAIGPPLAFALLGVWPLATLYLGCASLVAITGVFSLFQSRRGNGRGFYRPATG